MALRTFDFLTRLSGPVGIAVSGGCDSMALASVVSDFSREHGRIYPMAFSIDHQLRDESARDVQTVVENMQKMGIPCKTTRVKITKSLQGLEERARIARYKALAELCLKNGIAYLMTAHHQGDVAEQVLLRLSQGGIGAALKGINMLSPIPIEKNVYTPFCFNPAFRRIQLVRPLLSVSKDEIMRYCREKDVTWVEDRTNDDPTYCTRNAVRALLKGPLPQVLEPTNLIALSNAIKQKEDLAIEAAESMVFAGDSRQIRFRVLPEIGVSMYELTAKAVTALRFGAQTQNSSGSTQNLDVQLVTFENRMLEIMAWHAISVISPLSVVPAGPVQRVATTLLQDSQKRTVAGCMVIKKPLITAKQQHELSSLTDCKNNVSTDDMSKNVRLIFARQPMRPEFADVKIMELSPGAVDQILWDDRWWISVRNISGRKIKLEIRNVRDLDINGNRNHLRYSKLVRRAFKDRFKSQTGLSFSDISFSIPAIVCTRTQHVLSVPTMGYDFEMVKTSWKFKTDESEQQCFRSWERYIGGNKRNGR